MLHQFVLLIKMFFYREEFETPEEYLDYYYTFYDKFRVNKIYNGKAHKWFLYGTKEAKEFLKREKFFNNREVFPDEIVIDIDADKSLPKKIKKKRNPWDNSGTLLHPIGFQSYSHER